MIYHKQKYEEFFTENFELTTNIKEDIINNNKNEIYYLDIIQF